MTIIEFKKEIASNPENLDARQNLVTCYMDAGLQFEAIKCLRKIIQHWPENVDAYRMLGSLYIKQKDWQSAGEVLLKLTHLLPNNAPPLVNLAHVFDQLNNTAEAIKYSQMALAIKPDAVRALNILGFALIKDERYEEARETLEKLVLLQPDSTEAQYMLIALSEEKQPDKSPAEYVTNVFDGVAENFEHLLVDVLNYRVPELLNEAVRIGLTSEKSNLNVIDLGCGTGLMGEMVRDISGHLIGVDLSQKMLDEANKKQVYDELICKDIVDAMSSTMHEFDLVVSTDVFIYIGNLKEIFNLVSQSMKKGGLFCFSIEHVGNEFDYLLLNTGRYAQSNKYIHKLAEVNNFQVFSSEDIVCRMEKKKPVKGCIYILKCM
jgi:predicted TPR repeat methyltransferase